MASLVGSAFGPAQPNAVWETLSVNDMKCHLSEMRVTLSLLLTHRLAGVQVSMLWAGGCHHLGPVCWVRFLSPRALCPSRGSLSGALGREAELWHPVVETLVMPGRPGSLKRAWVEEASLLAAQPVSVSTLFPFFQSPVRLALFQLSLRVSLCLCLFLGPDSLSPSSRLF